MAAPLRSEPYAADLPAGTGGSGDARYGSLMGLGAPKKKKQPVLVLDPEELLKAHQAMAEGGAQIMESADLPEAERPAPRPAIVLGLAPMGADEAEDDGADLPALPEAGDYADEEDDFAWEGEPDAIEAAGFDETASDFEDEFSSAEDEEDTGTDGVDYAAEAAIRFENLLRPAAPEAQPHAPRTSVIPSIEEQLKKMRALPQPEAAPEPEAAPAPVQEEPVPPSARDETVPEVQAPVPSGAVRRSSTIERLEIDDWFEGKIKGPARSDAIRAVEQATPEQTPVAARPAEIEPEPDSDLQLELSADDMISDEKPAEPAIVEEVLEPEPAFPDAQSASEEYFDDDYDNGPDLGWMQPQVPRQLEIQQGQHSNLRARIVQHDKPEAPDDRPSLWQKIRAWLAQLWR